MYSNMNLLVFKQQYFQGIEQDNTVTVGPLTENNSCAQPLRQNSDEEQEAVQFIGPNCNCQVLREI